MNETVVYDMCYMV